MFDPTAFENIKVVIEGEIYDRDLSGEILVSDRNDWFNSAKLSRKYEISFGLADVGNNDLTATMTLEAGVENLCAEMLNMENAKHLAGCTVVICFSMAHLNNHEVFRDIQTVLESIWGVERAIEQIPQIPYFENPQQVNNLATITFDRLIYENQIEDLSEMIDYMIFSLQKLQISLNK